MGYRKVHLGESVELPTLVLSEATWTYVDSKCSAYTGKFRIQDCTLDSGAWITFDLDCTFGSMSESTNDKTFTPISKTCRILGFKLTYSES